jgi:hypothetical protein
VLQRFPKATVIFTQAKIMDPIERDKPMISSEKIYLQFNLLQLFRGEYVVDEVEFNTGSITLTETKSGANYNFWKSESADSRDSNFRLDLEKVVFSNIDFVYENKINKSLVQAQVQQAELKGNFTLDEFTLKSSGNILFHELSFPEFSQKNLGQVKFNLSTKINSKQKRYQIDRGNLTLKGINFAVSGNISETSGNEYLLNLIALVKNGSFGTIKSFLPENLQQTLDPYAISGKINSEIAIEGKAGTQSLPSISAKFEVHEAKFKETASKIELKNGTFEGEYLYDNKSDLLTLNHFHGDFGKGELSGNISIKNFSKPEVTLTLLGEVNVDELLRFTRQDFLEVNTGKLHLNLKASIKTSGYSNDHFQRHG